MKFRTFLVGLSALSIAVAAAFFSVTGLSKLFAGASLAVILMAGTLEAGKLIAASFLYEYWDRINKLLKIYLVTGVVVLIFITSLGIYGFLTAAYQETAEELAVVESRVELVDLKRERYNEQLQDLRTERQTLSESINELTTGLSNNVIQYENSEGEIITTTSSATRNVLNEQLDNAREERNAVSQRIEAYSDSLTALDIERLNIQQESEVSAEVGPLKYLADVTGKEMSFIVNIFALLIVFVFDPLAVTLVIAFNTALRLDRNEKKKKEVEEGRVKGYKVYNEGGEEDIPDEVSVPSVWTDEPLNEDVEYYDTSDDTGGFDFIDFDTISDAQKHGIDLQSQVEDAITKKVQEETEEEMFDDPDQASLDFTEEEPSSEKKKKKK